MMTPVLVLLIIFGSAIIITKLAFEHSREKSRSPVVDAGSTVTTDELRGLIREAVAESLDERLTPLEAKLDALEERRQLHPANVALDADAPGTSPVPRDREMTQ